MEVIKPQSLSWFSPAEMRQHTPDDVQECGMTLIDGPVPFEAQGLRQAPERGHDLNGVGLTVAVGVLVVLGDAGAVPGVLN